GIPTFASTWTLPFTETFNTGNALTGGHANMADFLTSTPGGGTPGPMSPANIQLLFRAQSQGNNLGSHNQGFLNEMTDSVFFRNTNAIAYVNSDILGPNPGSGLTVTVSGGSSPNLGNVVAASLPVKAMTRGSVSSFSAGGVNLSYANVISLD